MSKNLIEIVAAGLKAEEFGGLVMPGMCGCLVDDLSPADCIGMTCEPGHKHTHSQRPDDWIVSTRKDGVTDADIEQIIDECC